MEKIIKCEKTYKVTDMCQICFSNSQSVSIYKLDLGFKNGLNETKQTTYICSKCLKELKLTIRDL